MILYRPTDGEVDNTPIKWRKKTCFFMTQLGGKITPELKEVQDRLALLFSEIGYDIIDANGIRTGKDFLNKIWKIMVTVPVGIAIVQKGIKPKTMANIFYELGMMQILGKETITIKVGNVALPSDVIRTEYIEYGTSFDKDIRKFMGSLTDAAEHYIMVSEQLDNNPLLVIDYLRRAYLITGDDSLQEHAKEIMKCLNLSGRAKNSVETLLSNF